MEIDRGDGRYRPGARLTLANPELMEDWPRHRENVFVKNKVAKLMVTNRGVTKFIFSDFAACSMFSFSKCSVERNVGVCS